MEYNRANAVAYAKKWAYGRNPKYYDFSDLGGDCTNFASQCIYAGSGVMNYTPTYGWYYISVNNRAPAWTGVDELYRFLTTNRGAGYIGSHTCVELLNAGYEIVVLDNLYNASEKCLDAVKKLTGKDFPFYKVDLLDKEATEKVFAENKIDAGNRTPQSILVAAHSYDADCRPLSSYRYIKIRPLHITNVGE